MTITACYVVKNEAEFLDRSLQSVAPYCDQIVVVDTGSVDGTVDIATKWKAESHRIAGDFFTWGEKRCREHAFRLCRCDWILTVDGDQIVSDGWKDQFLTATTRSDGPVGVVEARYYDHMGSYEYLSANCTQQWWHLFYRRHPHLHYTGGKPPAFAHGSFYDSRYPRRVAQCPGIALFHYGYCKSDMKSKMRDNFLRLDYGQAAVEGGLSTINQGLEISLLGPVKPVTYSASDIPLPMRAAFGTTWKLEIDGNCRIRSRTRIEAG